MLLAVTEPASSRSGGLFIKDYFVDIKEVKNYARSSKQLAILSGTRDQMATLFLRTRLNFLALCCSSAD